MRFGGPLERIKWDDPPIPPKELMRFRTLGDRLADEFVSLLSQHPFPDLPPPPANAADQHLSRAFRVLEHLAALPPSESDPPLAQTAHHLWASASALPPWLDRQLLSRGQEVFLERTLPSFMVLLYGSLMGGFAAPWIAPVLKSTGYLTSEPKKAVRRLFETTSFVIDCVLDAALPLHGSAWRSALSVRLLHAQVRHRLGKSPYWRTEAAAEWGVPINQEDQAVTLLSFSWVVLMGLEQLGYRVSPADQAAFLHLWRYVGFLLGVDDRVNFCTSPQAAEDGLSSLLSHLLKPDETSVLVARGLLEAMCELPSRLSPGCHAQYSRIILGHDLCDALGLPRPNLVEALIVRTSLVGLRGVVGIHHFLGEGARGRLRDRSRALCKGLIRMTIKRAANFELQEEPKYLATSM